MNAGQIISEAKQEFEDTVDAAIVAAVKVFQTKTGATISKMSVEFWDRGASDSAMVDVTTGIKLP